MQQEINIKSGQTIFDLALAGGYTIDYVYTLIKQNSFISNINYDFEANPQQILSYNDSFIIPKPPQLTAISTTQNTAVAFVAVQGQTVFDIAIQASVGMDNILTLIKQNQIVGLNDTQIPGKTINFNTGQIQDVSLYNRLKKSLTKIATGQSYAPFVLVNYRITEAGNYRILESGERRILE